jgi:hypothetical protein
MFMIESSPRKLLGQKIKVGFQMNTVQLLSQPLETSYINPDSLPWVPFVEGTEIKLLKANPITGQFIALLKATADTVMPNHAHHGTVLVHTIQGFWTYEGEDWIAGPGDVIYEPAGSIHRPIMVNKDGKNKDVVALNILDGALQFLDDNGNTLFILNWLSALEMYKQYCQSTGTKPVDVTKF